MLSWITERKTKENQKTTKINKKGEDTDMSVLHLYGYF